MLQGGLAVGPDSDTFRQRIDWMKRQELRGVFEANYGELLAEIGARLVVHAVTRE